MVYAVQLARLGKIEGYGVELFVQSARREAQGVEGGLRGEFVPFHQEDSLGLADDIAGQHGRMQVFRQILQGVPSTCRPGGHGGMRGQNKPDLLRLAAEGARLGTIGVQRSCDTIAAVSAFVAPRR